MKSGTTAHDTFLQAAIEYANLGYSVFPCSRGDKKPLTEHGCLDATTDEDQIVEWWEKTKFANIGISTNGLLVVDVDGPGNEWLSDSKIMESRSTGAMSKTASGGRHFIFKQPPNGEFRNTTGKLALNVDTRADGGYIIAPPSQIGPNAYEWLPFYELSEKLEDLVEAPEWIIDKLAEVAQERFELPISNDGKIPKGYQHNSLFKFGCFMRRGNASYYEINAALQTMNANRCEDPGSVGEIQKIAESAAKYEPDQATANDISCLYEQMFEKATETEPESTDPGPLDECLLRIPGFISEVMDCTLESAPYPNQVLAFCGALALQSFLGGRKVRDQLDNRTNLYLLGLAHSGAGKDCPRKVNVEVLSKIGLINCLGEKFASGEGLQDALYQTPNMLFQTDEFDGILQSISHSKDARFEGIMGTLLTLYSSADSTLPMRKKAGQVQATQIDQPCLTVFGTAIPQHYYAALSDRMLTNGLFSRMIILEGGKRSEGQDSKPIVLPSRVLESAKWWGSFTPASGNLSGEHPTVATVEHSTNAIEAIRDARKQADSEYSKAEQKADSIGMAVWSRASQHICKLSLIYAISEDHRSPQVSENAVSWAVRLIFHLTQKMLYNAHHNTFENPFQELCNKAVRWIQARENETGPRAKLLKHLRTDAKSLDEIVRTLEESGTIKTLSKATKGRTGVLYTTNLSLA